VPVAHICIATKRHSELRNTEVAMCVFAETSVLELHVVCVQSTKTDIDCYCNCTARDHDHMEME